MMRAYKGFNEKLQCTPAGKCFQYEVGKTYEEPTADLCHEGFHACEAPLDVFAHYAPAGSRFCAVDLDEVSDQKDGDSKRVGKKITIKAEIGIAGLVKAHLKYINEKVDWENAKESNTGYRSAATNTGNSSAATNTGYRSAATNTGNSSASTNTGNSSAATNTGDCSAATNTGDSSAATNTGDRSAATNTGDYSASTNTGDCSAATNTGNSSAATNTGYCSAATNTGYRSASTNTGDYSASTNTGYRSAATNTGNSSAASVEGEESIAIVTGYNSKAKGALGDWIVLTERDDNYHILGVKAVKVDGKKIKADTYYQLQGKKILEVK